MDRVFLCVLPLAPAVRTSNGSIFDLLVLMLSIRPWCFIFYFFIFSRENLSLQYVNSMNCTVSVGLGSVGGSALYG